MLKQYAPDLLDRQRLLLRRVSGFDHKFAFDPVEVTAGVRNHAVAAAGDSGLAEVADHRMVFDLVRHGDLTEHLERVILGIEVAHSENEEAAKCFAAEIREVFPNSDIHLDLDN